MSTVFQRSGGLFLLLFTVSSLLLGYVAIPPGTVPAASTPPEPPLDTKPEILLDPGHGGEDGGAEADGILEKDLNLAVAFSLSDLYTVFGYDVRLTRTEDTLLYDAYHDREDYRGKKKTYDLRNRLRMAEEQTPDLFVGIHMNIFPVEKYRGLQVYYSPHTPESQRAAENIQSCAKTYLDPDNTRQCKQATQAIYILHRIFTPAVLVECGFLSNPDERALLDTPAYRTRLAAVLFAATAAYLASP